MGIPKAHTHTHPMIDEQNFDVSVFLNCKNEEYTDASKNDKEVCVDSLKNLKNEIEEKNLEEKQRKKRERNRLSAKATRDNKKKQEIEMQKKIEALLFENKKLKDANYQVLFFTNLLCFFFKHVLTFF